jgi:hypothetical protein
MGWVIRDERQRQACTGVSQAPCACLLPGFCHVYQEAQSQRDAAGVEAGTRSRTPGAGSKGTVPPPAEQHRFGL